MKKLRLKLDGLQVESFEMQGGAAARIGTVRARSGSEYTQCYGGCGGTVDWGGCGGESDGVFGCGGSEECTRDPYNDACQSYAAQCPVTILPNASCYATCGAGGASACGAECYSEFC
jgi:hypothetical protein